MNTNQVFILAIAGLSLFAYPTLSALTSAKSAQKAVTAGSEGDKAFGDFGDIGRSTDHLSKDPPLYSEQSLERKDPEIVEATSNTRAQPTPALAAQPGENKNEETEALKIFQEKRTDIAANDILKALNDVKELEKPSAQGTLSRLLSRLKKILMRPWKKFIDKRLRKAIALLLRNQPDWLQRWAQEVASYHQVDLEYQVVEFNKAIAKKLRDSAKLIEKYHPELLATYKENRGDKYLKETGINF